MEKKNKMFFRKKIYNWFSLIIFMLITSLINGQNSSSIKHKRGNMKKSESEWKKRKNSKEGKPNYAHSYIHTFTI